MSERFFDQIDWPARWFDTVRPAAQRLVAAPDWRGCLNQIAQDMQLENHQAMPLQFIPQEELPDGVAYEAHISATGKVPTRENLHDFFNALVWLRFPRIKRQLNALQSAQIATLGIGKSRGPARDAATIFDENAALLVVENSPVGDQLITGLRQHQWDTVFLQQRKQFEIRAQVWSFGHALMEKLVSPYKAITAHTWVVRVDPEHFTHPEEVCLQQIDIQVSRQLMTQQLSTADYTPLPVLGIPGWWQHQDAAFYSDQTVFRPPRIKK
ncbi:DUF3025 domain-containing protein [Undibacterium sp. SXout20W]|uniref:DUF3025 domain-containing protein n=1 Tax=Undibacterium sp. SXout20W TaxID=3413051 RepID=UPI003BF04B39